MTKRTVTPLFAVAVGLGAPPAFAGNDTPMTPRTLPSGAPACGNAQVKGRHHPCRSEDEFEDDSPAQARPVTAVVPVAPRVLPTGAPACGNVLEKVNGDKTSVGYQYCITGIDPTAATAGFMLIKKTLVLLGLRDADPEPVIKANPRRMRNGAPACGNVVSRSAMGNPSPRGCK